MLKKLYSQAGQDLWVLRDVFGWMTEGFFLDIGAAGGIELSNTYALEQNFLWKGICVEADPRTFEELKINRKCRVVNTCLSGSAGQITFAARETFYGGIVKADSQQSLREGMIQVETQTLESLIAAEDIPETIHYLSIDVEGAEEDIISTFPFKTHRFLSATIERPSETLRARLKNEGYLLVAEHPSLDAFYIHSSLADSYRIRAIESALTRTLGPSGKFSFYLKDLLKHGIRQTIRRL